MITGKKYKNLRYEEVVQVGEHSVKMPSLPDDPREIFFFDEPEENAYWDRDKIMPEYRDIWFQFVPGEGGTKVNDDATLYDDNTGMLASLNVKDTKYIVDTYVREIKRRSEGVFCRIKDEIVWFTGDYWFVLMWCKTKRPDKKGDYFDYREFQRDFFYLIHHVNASPHILGLFISKPKKTGITNLMWLYYLNKATMTRNINVGAMNIDQDKSAKTFRDHFMYSYNGLPSPLKAGWKRKGEVEGLITFAQKTSAKKKTDDDDLNTTVMCVPTRPHAFDVDVFTDIWFDEPPKYTSDFGMIYRSNAAGTTIQDYIVGKIWLTSYTPDEDSVSFMSAKELFYDSELRTITEYSNGQTKSKLICYHIPAYKSWGTSFDKFGKCNEKEAALKIQHGRDQLRDKPRELLSLTRMYANTKREAWSIGGEGSAFDNIRLGELHLDIEEEERDSIIPLYAEGRLEWTNPSWEVGLKNRRPRGNFCPVKFVPLTKDEIMKGITGKVRMYNPIPRDYQNYALQFGRDDNSFLNPPPSYKFHVGGDPTAQAAASEVIQGSKNAFYLMSRPDDRIDAQAGRIVTGVIHLEYIFRPESPNEAYEDLVKLIIYTGALAAVEANVPGMATNLLEEGLGHYMLVKDENGVPVIWKRWMGLPNESNKKYSLLRTTGNADSKQMVEMFMILAKNYFYQPEAGAKDYGHTIKSKRLIECCMKFEPMNTKIYDAFMGWGYCLYSMEMYTNILLKPDDDHMNKSNIAAVLRALAA